jgi:hypothetical protein
MLSNYGWIMPLTEINHPDTEKHEGRIYMKNSDVAWGMVISPGDPVHFYLYADSQGLGAERVCPEGRNSPATTTTFTPRPTTTFAPRPTYTSAPWQRAAAQPPPSMAVQAALALMPPRLAETKEPAWCDCPSRVPGRRGSLSCLCRGQVIVMLSYYGWIAPLDDIDHQDKDKHDGRIYVKRSDLGWGVNLSPGDPVIFYLYADSRGLGAENVCPDSSAVLDQPVWAGATPLPTTKSAGWCSMSATADTDTQPPSGDEGLQNDCERISDCVQSDRDKEAISKAVGQQPVVEGKAKPPWQAALSPPPGLRQQLAPTSSNEWLADLPWRRK